MAKDMSMDKKNVGRGPTVGNNGNPTKRGDFKADKASKEGTAREIANAIGARAQGSSVPATHKEAKQGQVSPNTNKSKGPTKGNK